MLVVTNEDLVQGYFYMTKRLNNLYDKICDLENIEEADDKARKCKRSQYGVVKHDKNRREENLDLHIKLTFGSYKTSEYSTFKVYEPKERLIFRLPYYPDRITHHAIMNVMEPIWMKIFTKDTYSCIKGRGIHALSRQLRYDLRKDKEGTKYCAKMDIKKFYPSINHDILKAIIRKKLKDKKLLKLLDEIIDSADGVPIGNYLSQYFANLYLAYFDHWIKEVLRVKYYYRYADDIVLLSDDKNQLKRWTIAIRIYLRENLKLELKDNYQVFPVEARGIDFVGYVFTHTQVKLRKRIKKKRWVLIRKYKEHKISKEQSEQRITSYFGWLKYCDSKNLLKKIYQETGIRYTGWNGKRVNIISLKGKYIKVVTVQQKQKYYLIQFVYNNKSYETKSANVALFLFLNNLKFPKLIKL